MLSRKAIRFTAFWALVGLGLTGSLRAQNGEPKQGDKPLLPESLAPLATSSKDSASTRTTPVTLAEVLQSVERHYPLLIAARQQRAVADGQLLSARGGFDFRARGLTLFNTGSFENQRYGLGFEQPTAWNGVSFFGGYRMGAGEYPVYYQNRQTGEGGEFGLGMSVPLLRDRAIDARRANLRKAGLTRNLAEPAIATRSISFYRDASMAYWDWVAASRRLEIGQQLVSIAEKRDSFLRKLVDRGRLAGIEITDNLRTVYDRRTRLVQLRRVFEQTSLRLSLFLRDEAGCPVSLVGPGWAPRFPIPRSPELPNLDVQLDFALSRRPELAEIRLRQRRLGVDLALAENGTLPRVSMVLNAAQDVGQEKKSLDRTTYEAGVLVEVPLQRRDARGKILATRAQIAQLQSEFMFLKQSISIQVRNAYSALLRAYEAYQRASTSVELADQMVQAEVKKLEAGKSTILFVNLRELALADAQSQRVGTLQDYNRALADFRAVLGLLTLDEWLGRPSRDCALAR